MPQTNNPLLDEFAKLITDVTGAAQGLGREASGIVRARLERILRDLDVVQREEFEAVKAMAERARIENERLEARIEVLERGVANTAECSPEGASATKAGEHPT
jgi:BMFP domain-containing protein YqiC